MTLRIPLWLPIVLIVLGLAAGAFLLARGSGGDSTGSSSESPSAEAALPCDLEAATATIAAENPFPPGHAYYADPDLLDYVTPDMIGCADLTGDGIDEMVVRVYAHQASGLSPWLIFGANGSRWEPELVRDISARDLAELDGSGVRETIGAYADFEPMCCPSGERGGLVAWNGEAFRFEPDAGLGDGRIELAEDTVASIGGLDAYAGNLPDAAGIFGEASSYYDDNELCKATWSDIGLVINFANLGGANPCGPEGRIGTAVISGSAAEQAGWQLADTGLGVGSSQGDARSAFPNMSPRPYPFSEDPDGSPGRDWTLISTKSPYLDRMVPTVMARLNRGEVVGFSVFVGAAGE